MSPRPASSAFQLLPLAANLGGSSPEPLSLSESSLFNFLKLQCRSRELREFALRNNANPSADRPIMAAPSPALGKLNIFEKLAIWARLIMAVPFSQKFLIFLISLD